MLVDRSAIQAAERPHASASLSAMGAFGSCPADHLVVAAAGAFLVALRVDRAIDLIRLDPADVEEAKGLVPGIEYVSWVAKTAANLVLVHDLKTFLSRAEAESLDNALAAPESL